MPRSLEAVLVLALVAAPAAAQSDHPMGASYHKRTSPGVLPKKRATVAVPKPHGMGPSPEQELNQLEAKTAHDGIASSSKKPTVKPVAIAKAPTDNKNKPIKFNYQAGKVSSAPAPPRTPGSH